MWLTSVLLRKILKYSQNTTFEPALLEQGSVASITFERDLLLYINLVAPMARALKALEATDATAADVFMFCAAIACNIRDLFSRPVADSGISKDLAKKIITKVNKRYKEIIDNSPTDIYFTTFFLHPSTSPKFL